MPSPAMLTKCLTVLSLTALLLAGGSLPSEPTIPVSAATVQTGAAATDRDCWDDISCARTALGWPAQAEGGEPNEDEPNWDCRVHGNGDCGSELLATALDDCDERHAELVTRWACWDGAYLAQPAYSAVPPSVIVGA
jgi:hypothetical protein